MVVTTLADQQELQQPCVDTGCSLEDLSGATDDRDRERESQGNLG